MARLAALAERLRSSLWFIPAVFGVGAFALAATTLSIDRQLAPDDPAFFLFGGTADGARDVLATIAQSMLTFTALVFTITMLVLQLASSQLSPRVIRTFLRDRGNQLVLGLFIATFLYTLLVLRDVRADDAGSEFVPGLSTFVAFALLIASVAAFIYYIDHMAHSIRATSVIDNIAAETREAIDRLFPETLGEEPEQEPTPLPSASAEDALIGADTSGTLVSVDEEGLLGAADDTAAVVEVVPTIGQFVTEGSTLFRLHNVAADAADDELAGRLRRHLSFGGERTLQQDAAFGFRQLVDVGLRALSPSTNDPTTAVQAIDRLHDLLRRLARRSFPSPIRLNADGRPRVVVRRPDWDEYVQLAVDELRVSGAGQLQVIRRLRAMLEDLATITPPARRDVVEQELAELDRAADRAFESQRDQLRARQPSQRGDVASDGQRR